MDRIVFPVIPKMEQEIQRLRGDLELAHDAIEAIWRAQIKLEELSSAEISAADETKVSVDALATAHDRDYRRAPTRVRSRLVSFAIAEAVKLLPRERRVASYVLGLTADHHLEQYRDRDRLDEISH